MHVIWQRVIKLGKGLNKKKTILGKGLFIESLYTHHGIAGKEFLYSQEALSV